MYRQRKNTYFFSISSFGMIFECLCCKKTNINKIRLVLKNVFNLKTSNYLSKAQNWSLLFSANFFGALNDNFLKNCIIFVAISWTAPSWLNLSQLTTLVAASLAIPYLILSPLSGRISMRYSKLSVFRWCKIAEFPIVLLACVAFWNQWIFVAIFAVLIMGIQSCLYSPAKYGLIRDIGGEKGISFGSGIFEMMAFLGILIGTVVASTMSEHGTTLIICSLLIIFAIFGFISAQSIKVYELPNQVSFNSINPIVFLKQSYNFAKQYPYINVGIFGVAMFWLIGGLMQMNLIIHCKQLLYISDTATGIMMAVTAVGIAVGCGLAGILSKRIPLKQLMFTGLFGMILFLILIIVFNPDTYTFAVFIFLLAVLGGFFEVPCLAMVQQADIGRKLSDILAYMNFVIFIFIFIGSLLLSAVTFFTNENSIAIFITVLILCTLTAFVMIKNAKIW
jgi:acyl-[acyl-carrier-protein]-phospholipid O-acyltransferase/long-chain-fatty-acid--[acyl-carrier-protein] ligase